MIWEKKEKGKKKLTSVLSRLTFEVLDLGLVLREHRCDPCGEGRQPKVRGEEMWDQEQDTGSSPGHFALSKQTVYLET